MFRSLNYILAFTSKSTQEQTLWKQIKEKTKTGTKDPCIFEEDLLRSLKFPMRELPERSKGRRYGNCAESRTLLPLESSRLGGTLNEISINDCNLRTSSIRRDVLPPHLYPSNHSVIKDSFLSSRTSLSETLPLRSGSARD